MEKNDEKGKNIIIGILIGIIVCLTIVLVFVSYNKFIVKNETNSSTNNSVNNASQNNEIDDNDEKNNVTTINGMNDTISQKKSAFGSLEKYFENYVKYIPLRYDKNSNLVSYSVSDLTDREISMAVWRYIYKTKEGLSENSKLTKEEVYSYIDTYLNLENYSLKTMNISENNIFGLEENKGIYKISASGTEFSFPNFEISDATYDLNTGKVIVNGNQYSLEDGTGNKIKEKIKNLEIKYNGTNGAFNLINVTISK